MNSLNVPKTWATAKLGDICKINMGQSPKGSIVKNDLSGIPLIGGASNIKNGIILTNKSTDSPTKLCQKGDLIYCVRATIGNLSIADKKYCLGRGVAGITPKINSIFILYYLKNTEKELTKEATGSTFIQIDKLTLENILIPLPPLKEQRRIVKKIESCFTKINAIEENLNRTEALLKKFREAILSKAFRGQLVPQDSQDEPASILLEKIHKDSNTKKERPKPELISKTKQPFEIPKTWTTAKLGDISKINMGQSPRGSIVKNDLSGIPLISGASNIKNGIILTNKSTDSPTKLCQKGDLIYCVRATIGNLSIADKKYCLGRGVAGITPKINSIFILYYLKNTEKELTKEATGSTFIQIDKLTLENILIPLPPLKEQRRIVEKIESCFEKADRILANIKAKKLLLKQLRESILKKAFKGRLVEQRKSEGTGHTLLHKLHKPSLIRKSHQKSYKNEKNN